MERKSCTNCHVNLPLNHFKEKRNGDFTRTCNRCLIQAKMSKINNKCIHSKRKNYCEFCGGASLCVHNVSKHRCPTCNIEGCIRQNITHRMWCVLGYSNFEYLGCSLEAFMADIEGQFKEGMSWDNYGEWTLDHKKPLGVKGLTEEEIIERLEFTNVQPLWADENRRKGNKEL